MQARKTGNASPLGLLFDHGCDACNAAIMTIPLANALGFGNDPNLLFQMMSISFIGFHVQTWEEYYREEMVFQIVNGAVEGILIYILLCLISFFYGQEFWIMVKLLKFSNILYIGS